jgi:hypothetical protein
MVHRRLGWERTSPPPTRTATAAFQRTAKTFARTAEPSVTRTAAAQLVRRRTAADPRFAQPFLHRFLFFLFQLPLHQGLDHLAGGLFWIALRHFAQLGLLLGQLPLQSFPFVAAPLFFPLGAPTLFVPSAAVGIAAAAAFRFRQAGRASGGRFGRIAIPATGAAGADGDAEILKLWSTPPFFPYEL